MTLTYQACKSLIDRKSYESKEEMQTKLDIFLLNNRLSKAEYDELTAQLVSQ